MNQPLSERMAIDAEVFPADSAGQVETERFPRLRRMTAVASASLLALGVSIVGLHDEPIENQVARITYESDPLTATSSTAPEIPAVETIVTSTTTTTTEVPTTTTIPEGRVEAASCRYVILSSRECVVPVRPPGTVALKRHSSESAEELARVYELLDQVNPTPEEYQNFKLDTSRSQALTDILPANGQEAIWPTYYVAHWVGYEALCATIDDCIERMRVGGKSYGILTMEDGKNYLIAPTPHSRTDHALGANFESIGHSVNANSITTLLRAPDMLEQVIYGALWSAKEYDRPLERSRFISHADIVHPEDKLKVDYVAEVQDGLFARVMELNHEVYVLGQGGHPSPLTP